MTRPTSRHSTFRFLLCAATLAGAVAVSRPAAAQSVTEFPLPTVPSSPFGIASGPLGRLWFTEFLANKVGSITVEGIVDELANVSSGPANIVAGPDGNLWFTILNANRIGRLTPTGTLTFFNDPATTEIYTGGVVGSVRCV